MKFYFHFSLILFLLFFQCNSFAQGLNPVYPKPGQVISKQQIQFIWNSAPESISYNFELYADAELTDLLTNINTTDNHFESLLNSPGENFWRIQAVYDGNETSDWSQPYQFIFFKPTFLNELAFWFAADSLITSLDNKVSQWGDLSENNFNLIQNNSINQPELIENGLHAKPSIKFDGINDFMISITNQVFEQPNTFFIIWRMNSNSTGFALDGTSSGLSNSIYWFNNTVRVWGGNSTVNYIKSAPFNYIMSSAFINQTASKIFENGQQKASGNSGNLSLENIRLGSRYDSQFYFNGEIVELLFYDRFIEENERILIERYLSHKYTPPVNLGTDTLISNLCSPTLSAGPNFQSYQWNTGETTQTIEATESGIYSVTVTDIFGFQSSDTIHVSFPNTNLNDKNPLLCLGDTRETFPLISIPEAFSYEWNTGEETHTIEITEAGSYWVKITDSEGCFAYSDTLVIEIDDFPSSVVLNTEVDLCAGNLLEINLDEENQNLTFLWNTGSTESSIPVFESGVYSVSVTNENNCTGYDEVFVNIIGTAPDVDFNASTVCLGFETEFTDLSQPAEGDEIVSWQWMFDGENQSFEQNPIFTFTEPGHYPVSLNVEALSGCIGTVEKNVTVLNIPLAQFSFSDACIGYPVLFADESFAPESEEISQWLWNFGDGNTSEEPNPEYIYLQSGSFEVQLTTFLENGCSDTYSKSILIPDNLPLPSDFTLVYPKQGQLISNTSSEFSWNLPANVYGFVFEISEDPDMLTVLDSYQTFNQNITIELPQIQKVYWRVKAYNACRDTIESNINSFSLFNPLSIDNLTLWLAADSLVTLQDGGVSQWNDLSGNNFHAIQNSPANRPLLINNSLNDKPTIKFDGVNDFLFSETNQIFEQPNTFFAVWKLNSSNTGFVFDGANSDGSNALYWFSNTVRIWGGNSTVNYAKTAPFDFIISSSLINQSASRLYENAQLKVSGNAGSTPIENFRIGSRHDSQLYLNGDIAEILFFNGNLETSQRLFIEKYLQNKYSPPVNLSFDRNIPYGFCPVTLDAGERFEAYLWNTGEITQTIEVQEPGTYSVTVTDIFGFQSSDSVEVRFPAYGLNVGEVTVCLGEEVELSWSDTAETGRARSSRETITSPRPPSKGELGRQELRASDPESLSLSGFRASPSTSDSGLRTSDYSFLWNTGDTTQTITVTETGTYTVLVMDTLGCSREFSATVFVDDFEVAATLGEPRPFCMGDTLYVESVWDPALLSHVWNDGSTLPGLVIHEPGEYSVMVTNPNGCVAQTSTILDFQGYAPEVDFTATTPCFGEASLFTGTSSAEGSEITTRLWYFGDPGNEGATDSGEEVSYTYSQPGIFNATLAVESAAGCSRSRTLPVQVYHLPEGWFTPNNACTDVPVLFNDASADVEGGIGQWQWSFYDTDGSLAGQSTEASPEFTFSTPGTAHVELIPTSVVGCNDTIMRAINIKEAPAVAFDFTTPCWGEPVFFTDNTTAPPWALITGQQWDFGDGNTSAQSNPSHMYQQPGVYDVTLSVTAINGCSPALTRQVTVHSPPDVNFATPALCVNTLHTFMDESTVDNSTMAQWLWNFGGQGTSTQQFPEFAFSEPGQYMVSLTATSAAGCSGSTTLPIDVYPAPEPEFTYFPRYGVAPLTVSFTNLTQGASLYNWDFGDGSAPVTSPNPVHTFTENGVYVTELTAFSELGCAAAQAQEIKVIPLYIDVAVTNARYTVRDNLLQVSATLQNLGTLEFDTLFLEYHLSGRDPIRETWTGLLLPGQSTDYTFRAQLPWRDTYTHFCIEAFIPRLPRDDMPGNNRDCFSFKDEFRLLPAFPNPAEGYVNIGFILPYSDRVTITLSDIRGHTLATLYDALTEQGVTTLRIPIEEYNNGIYFYRITFREESKVGRFMKW